LNGAWDAVGESGDGVGDGGVDECCGTEEGGSGGVEGGACVCFGVRLLLYGIGDWGLEDEHCAATRLRMLVHTTNAVRAMMDV
jgi:hypothetical protein